MSPSPAGVATTSQDSAGNSDGGGGGDAAEASGGGRRRRRPGWRQVWNKERLQLLRHAQDNAARQRRHLQLRRVTEELLEALRELEGPDLRWQRQQHEQQPEQQPCRWVSDQLDLLADLDLVERAAVVDVQTDGRP